MVDYKMVTMMMLTKALKTKMPVKTQPKLLCTFSSYVHSVKMNKK